MNFNNDTTARYAVEKRHYPKDGMSKFLGGTNNYDEAVGFALSLEMDGACYYVVYDRQEKKDVFSLDEHGYGGVDPQSVAIPMLLNNLRELLYNWMQGSLVLPVQHCARCGQDHEKLNYKAFVNPIEDEDGTVWSHWALCPVTGDPVLMRKLPDFDANFGSATEAAKDGERE